LLKYQLPSPLENVGVAGFRVRPFRLLLRFLKRARDEGLVGLTKDEIGLYVITMLTEDDATFDAAFDNIRAFRMGYEAATGKVAKTKFAQMHFARAASPVGLKSNTFLDYADSNSRYALMSGLLTLRGNKLVLADTRVAFVESLLAASSTLVPQVDYLAYFYDPNQPTLPTDDPAFLKAEVAALLVDLRTLADALGTGYALPPTPASAGVADLQAYDFKLRAELRRLREEQFYRSQQTPDALADIAAWLEAISERKLLGGATYAPAYLEWVIWRLFLAVNQLVGPVGATRGFKIGDDMQPLHHARGGAADLTFTYSDYVLVCEMTLARGSQQFTMEGEPVTRHVHKAIEASGTKPVYGLFITPQLDPNTADAFYKARYWPAKEWTTPVQTPVVALELDQIRALVRRMQTVGIVTPTEMRLLLDDILAMQHSHDHGPGWFHSYSKHYETWVAVGAPVTSKVT